MVKKRFYLPTIKNCYKAFKSLLTAADEFELIKDNPHKI